VSPFYFYTVPLKQQANILLKQLNFLLYQTCILKIYLGLDSGDGAGKQKNAPRHAIRAQPK
jgi:hypothetical protein